MSKKSLSNNNSLNNSLQNATQTLQLIKKVNSIIKNTSSVNKIILSSMTEICDELDWDLGHVYILESNILKPTNLWYQNNKQTSKTGIKNNDEFIKVTEETEFKLDEGLPGKILKNKAALIEDITSKNNLIRAKKCKKNVNIKTVMGCPIISNNYQTYILEFFSYEEIEHSDNIINFMNILSDLISEAIEKKQDERKLKYSEKLNSAVIDSSLDAIIVINTQGKIKQVNESTSKMFGYTSDELINKNINILMGSDHKKNHDNYIKKYLETGIKKLIGKPRKLKAKTKNDEDITIFLTLTEMNLDNELLFMGTIRNITQIEELTNHSTQLEELNQELEQFAYITSHDLKAPLRAIENLALWIREDNEDKLDEESQNNLKLLCSRVDRMANLIDGILEYSRAGRINLESSDVSVKQLLDEIKSDIDIPESYTLTYPSNMPSLHTSKISLYQIFSNLISNAIKYHDKPSGKVDITYNDEGDFIKFSIKDDGPGIEQDYQNKVFELFQTLQSRDKIDSTGIGLTIVKKLVESQHGNIALNSELGHGSEFIFTWPKSNQTGDENEQSIKA